MSEQHKFLSVAHDMGKLEIEHAFHVFQEQGMQDPNHRIPVGDLAVRHKFLRPYDIGTILAEQRRRRTSIDYHGDKDILSEFEHKFLTFKSSHAELATRLRIMAGVLMPVS